MALKVSVLLEKIYDSFLVSYVIDYIGKFVVSSVKVILLIIFGYCTESDGLFNTGISALLILNYNFALKFVVIEPGSERCVWGISNSYDSKLVSSFFFNLLVLAQ